MTIEERIDYAARESLVELGLKGTTMSHIARVAGVSRPTVYKRYRSVEHMATEILTKELMGLVDHVFPLPHDVVAAVDRIVEITATSRANELLRSIIENSPELLLTYQYHRFGTSQRQIITLMSNWFKKLGAADPALREEDPHVLAVFVLTAVQAAVLSADIIISEVGSEQAWREELTQLLKGYLLS